MLLSSAHEGLLQHLEPVQQVPELALQLQPGSFRVLSPGLLFGQHALHIIDRSGFRLQHEPHMTGHAHDGRMVPIDVDGADLELHLKLQ